MISVLVEDSKPRPRSLRQRIRDITLETYAHRRAYILTGVASFGGMLFGWDTGLIGGVLTMESFERSFNLDPRSSSYANLSGNIVSVLQAGCFFGAMASFWLSDLLGRKMSLIAADVVFLVGSLLQTTSAIGAEKSGAGLAQLYVGRVVGGFGVGLISAVVPTYIGENANKEIRGRCIGTMQLFNVTGIALAYFVNLGVSNNVSSTGSTQWRIAFAMQMLPGILLLLGLLFQNESPRWLVEKGRTEAANCALAHVRAKPVDDATVVLELQEIIEDFTGRERLSLLAQVKAACSSKSILYRWIMAIVLMFWQQWTGTNSINYYSPQIFQSIGLAKQSAGLFATGIYGVVKMVFTLIGLLFATEQLGRKWSLLVGGLGQAFAFIYVGIDQAVHPTDSSSHSSLHGDTVFAIVCIYLFVVFYSFGWGPIPFVLSSECSPNHVRSLIMASALMTQWLFNFVIAKLTPIMLSKITYGTFLLFGACCLLMSVYVVVFVPETSGVPLESIHLLFEGKKIRGALGDTWSRRRAKELRTRSDLVRSDVNAGIDVSTSSLDESSKKDRKSRNMAGAMDTQSNNIWKQGAVTHVEQS